MTDYEGWEPHTVTTHEVVETGPVTALQSLFDDGLDPLGAGDPLPPLWHWVALPLWSPSGVLALDGHPRKGSFLPPVELPRRMFAGGQVEISAPIAIGSTVRRESEVVDVAHKSGRSGELVVVDVATRLYTVPDGGGPGELAVSEVQNLIYREAGASPAQASDPTAPLAAAAALAPANEPFRRVGEWEWSLTTDPTLLMRFSAATANAHRIHYDWPYATQVEGYPGLVVHGPLMTLALAEVARLERHSGAIAPITRLAHRNLAPLFCGDDAVLRRTSTPADDDGTTVQLVSAGPDGTGTPRTSLTFWVG